jgi:hypothetical protein
MNNYEPPFNVEILEMGIWFPTTDLYHNLVDVLRFCSDMVENEGIREERIRILDNQNQEVK